MVEQILSRRVNRRELIKGALSGLVLASPAGKVAEFAEIQSNHTRQFLDIVQSERPRHPELIPDRTVIDILGLNVLSGIENPKQTIADMKTLGAKSILYVGTDEEFLSALCESELAKNPMDRASTIANRNESTKNKNQTTVITRYLSPDNSNKIEPNGFMHTVHLAKRHIGATFQDKPIIEIFNEANIYPGGQNSITPQVHARDFMSAAVPVIQNGCIPLLPPFAPHTGSELAWYKEFLREVSFDPRFRYVAPHVEVSLHGYARNRFDDPFMHLAYIATMLQEVFKRKPKVHYTEFGLSPDLANRLNPVERALVLKRILERPLPNSSPIETLNLWALASKPPQDTDAENYVNQVLRIPGVGISPMYTAVLYTKEKRKNDLWRKQQYKNGSAVFPS